MAAPSTSPSSEPSRSLRKLAPKNIKEQGEFRGDDGSTRRIVWRVVVRQAYEDFLAIHASKARCSLPDVAFVIIYRAGEIIPKLALRAMTETWSDELLLSSLAGIAGVDAQSWKRAGGTGAGGYFYAAPGVLVAVPAPGYMQAVADAKRSLEECHRIVREHGRPHAVIVLVDRVASQDGSARRVWAEARDHDLRCGMALVCRSALARAIGSFFIGLNRPAVPTRMFRDFPDALMWTVEMVRQAWASRNLSP